jgi:ABC-type transporter MlaC component
MRFFRPIRLLMLAATLGVAVQGGAADTAGENPDVASAKAWLEKLFDSSKKVNGPEQKAARAHIEAALDWDEVARTCLGEAEWKRQSAKNRNEFRNLLKEVIVRTAFSRMDKFWDGAEYTWEKVTVTGNKATARAKFVLKEDAYVLDYYLEKVRGGGWRITDIAFEDLRYSVNINEQLNAFLKEKSFSQLLANLRKRRDELASGKKG